MSKYIKYALHKFRHRKPQRKQYSPHEWIKAVYGRKQKIVQPDISEPQLSLAVTRKNQVIIGTCIYYAQVVNMPIQPALNSLVII